MCLELFSSFFPCLLILFLVLLFQVAQNHLDITDPNFKLEIKVSGDGAKMSRLTSFLVISFSVLNNQSDVMSSKGMVQYRPKQLRYANYYFNVYITVRDVNFSWYYYCNLLFCVWVSCYP